MYQAFRFAAGPGAPTLARSALSAVLRDVIPTDRLSDLMLATSELVTNVVRHVELEPMDEIRLELTCDDGRVRVEVIDRGIGYMPRRPSGSFGYGLFIVRTVTDRSGIDNRDGTRAWFEVEAA